MGVMVDGVYLVDDQAPSTDTGGRFQRARSTLRDSIPEGRRAEDLHLFVAWNCPWAHRALITRALLGLEDISASYALPRRTEQGWVFDEEPLLGAAAMHQVYAAGAEAYTGRVTVPVLWDKTDGRILNNESADVIRALEAGFAPGLLRPADKAEVIDRWNDLIYPALNNGVYRTGFAETQAAYDEAVREVFAALDAIEAQLAETRFLTGDAITEADVRLFPTLARFDVAYHSAFKCNLRRLIDYPNIWGYARDLYQQPGVAETVDFDVYRRGYHSPSEKRNPLGIVPIGPQLDWDAPHGRG
ncbi:MAG: glutathione S-transferase C-terminal domain-containing protein [Pseudomonadota bacterium]